MYIIYTCTSRDDSELLQPQRCWMLAVTTRHSSYEAALKHHLQATDQAPAAHDFWVISPAASRILSNGYGSIPISTILSGMNIHKFQLFWCSPGGQGFDTLPNEIIIWIWLKMCTIALIYIFIDTIYIYRYWWYCNLEVIMCRNKSCPKMHQDIFMIWSLLARGQGVASSPLAEFDGTLRRGFGEVPSISIA